MKFNYRDRLPFEFSDESRVWIYQSDRLFTAAEVLQIEERLYSFTAQWQSHGIPVKGYGIVLFGLFIILMADESATGVSGCSTDGSVRLVKKIEQDLGVQLLDRQLLAFIAEDSIRIIPLSQLNDKENIEWIGPETLYFNNMVQTKKELVDGWIIPVKESWFSKQNSRFQHSLRAEVAHLVERQLPKL
jgi:hypothetical protein